MYTDDDRRYLFDLLEGSLGERGASILMGHLPPTGWGDLATRADVLATATELRGEMAELRAELRGEMAELRAELRGEMAELRGEMAELRGELKGELGELRGEMRSMLPKLVTANIASMIGIAGMLLGAAALVG